jgi:hypothetical protein
MEVTCKIIRLKPENTSIGSLIQENAQRDHIAYRELQITVANAKNVLDTMEEEWRVNHNSIDLVDQFHLLRNYLELLRRYYEGNV